MRLISGYFFKGWSSLCELDFEHLLSVFALNIFILSGCFAWNCSLIRCARVMHASFDKVVEV